MADDYAYPPSIRGQTQNYFTLITYNGSEETKTMQTIEIPPGSDAYAVVEGRKIVFSQRGQYTDPRIFDDPE